MSVPLPFPKMTVKVTHEGFLLSVSLSSLCIGPFLICTLSMGAYSENAAALEPALGKLSGKQVETNSVY